MWLNAQKVEDETCYVFARSKKSKHTVGSVDTLPFRAAIGDPQEVAHEKPSKKPSTRLAMRDLERNEVVDLDSRSVLPSGPWGLVVGFRRRGLMCSKDRPSISLQQKSATETDKMPQLRFWARSPMRCQALDTALVAPATGSTNPLSDSALGMSVEAVRCAGRGGPSGRADVRCKSISENPQKATRRRVKGPKVRVCSVK
eukprot:scaffold727_cov28-Phaeocystis_antarctica.AAC.1